MKKVLLALSLIGILAGIGANSTSLPAAAQWSSGQFNGTIDDLDAQTDTLVKTVQIFLQTRGRWYPQPTGADMQLCYALKDLKSQVDKLQKRKGRESDLQNMLGQLNSTASGVYGLLRQTGVDDSVMTQWRMVNSTLQSLGTGYNVSVPINPSPWNPSPGWQRPDYNPWAPTLISSTFLPPNSVSVSWRDQSGRQKQYTSVLDSYTLDNGRHSRPARGEEVHLLSTAYADARKQNPNFNGTPLNISQRGRGTFFLTGQPPIMINQVEVRSPKWSPEVQVRLQAAHGNDFTMNGVLNNYQPGGFSVNVQNSGMGATSGTLQANIGAFNRLYSFTGNGTLNGRPFSLQFTQ